jgi:colicin import membrane protein
MAEKELNKIIVLEPCSPVVEELLKKIEDAKQAELIRLNNPDEAVQLVKQHQPCMLFTCTINNADIPIRVNMLKKLEQSIKYGLLKTLFVSKLKNRQLGTLITSLGVTDFIEEPVPARTLQFKANLQLKAVDTIRKQQEMKKASQEKIVFKKTEQKQDGAQTTTDLGAKLKPALKLEEDTFLFKNSGIKKAGKKTLVELEGPDPETGEWVPHEDKGDAKTSWRWMPNEKKALPPEEAKKEGWIHEGDKPQFSEESGKWQFGSEKPELSYQKNGEKVASKITTDESGEVNVAEDSPKAEENLKKNKDIAVKKREKEKKHEKKEFKAQEKEKSEDQAATLKSLNSEKAEDQAKTSAKQTGEEEEHSEIKIGKQNTSEQGKGLTKAMEKLVGQVGEQESDVTDPILAQEPQEEKPKSPLDFLKKKQEAKNKSSEKTISKKSGEKGEDKEIGIKSDTNAEEDKKEKIPNGEIGHKQKSSKSSKGAAKEALERLKRKAEQNTKIGSVEVEQNEAQEISASEESAVEVEKITPTSTNKESDEKTQIDKKLDLQKAEREKKISLEKKEKLKPEERKAKKRDILSKIQSVLNKPIPETFSEEEEIKLREELGLQGNKEIPVKELAKRARLKKVKELKEKLDELNGFTEEEAEFKKHDLKKDEIENTWSQQGSSGEKETRGINAYDSEEKENNETDSTTESKKQEKKSAREKKPIEDRYLYLPESEVKPLGGAWEVAGEYYVFLESTVRYRGFDKIDNLCPMLFYRGDKIPELLDKTKQWKFLDRLPQTALKFSEVPREIRDYLLGLKNQLEGNKEKDNEPKEKTLGEVLEEKKAAREIEKAEKQKELLEKNSRKQEEEFAELMGSLNKDTEPSPEIESEEKVSQSDEEKSLDEIIEESTKKSPIEDTASTLEEGTKKKENKDKNNLKDLMASLEKEEAEQKEKFSEEEIEDSKSKNTESDASEEEKAESKSDNLEEAIEKEAKKERSKESSDLESRLAALKSKIEDPFIEETSKKSKPETPLASEGVDAVKDKLKAESPALEKFLERRKNKKDLPPKELGKLPPVSKVVSGPQSPFLSVYVAISNAFGSDKDPTRSAQKILISLETNFGNCTAFVFFDKGPIEAGTVQISSDGSGIGEKIPIANGLIRPIQLGVGSEEGSFLGYLFLRPSGGREFFSAMEEETVTKVAASLWSILVRTATSEAKAA